MLTNNSIHIKPSSPVALFVKNLFVGYRSGQAKNILFNNVNLSLLFGKLTCFMGPNGIGKSTLIRTLAGLQKPLSGERALFDEKNIALVLTDKISSATMTVFELVSYGRYPYIDWQVTFSENDNAMVWQALTEVNITSLAKKKIEELSDGQLQLAMIARALAQQTPIILLDEPTAHLDLNNRLEIMKLLRRIAHENNKAILIATHELDLALQMADRIWLATLDKKINVGIPEDLVIDGSFDDIFQFKGFDLRTGKIQHTVFQQTSVNLQGEGYGFHWTKNALEREGFSVVENGTILITMDYAHDLPKWRMNDQFFNSLEALLDALK